MPINLNDSWPYTSHLRERVRNEQQPQPQPQPQVLTSRVHLFASHLPKLLPKLLPHHFPHHFRHHNQTTTNPLPNRQQTATKPPNHQTSKLPSYQAVARHELCRTSQRATSNELGKNRLKKVRCHQIDRVEPSTDSHFLGTFHPW